MSLSEERTEATPAAEPTVDFREQTLQRLQQESEPQRPLADAVDESEVVEGDGPYPSDPSDDETVDLEAETLDSEVEETDETETSDHDDEGADDDVDVDWRKRFEDAQAELKRQTANRREIEEGFRTRTEALAKAAHEIEDRMQGVEQASQFYASIAENGVKQFDSINWQELQSRPEEYQAMRARFQSAMQYRDQMASALGAVQKTHEEQREQLMQRQAEVSRDILKSTIPDWGNELYATLRDHAVNELNYTADEVNDITDWRFMKMLHRDYERAKAKDTVTRVKRKKQASPDGTRNKPQPRHRNARGQFQTARQHAFENPGDKGSFREAMARKLQAEREGR
jgi:hypothetical protein